MTDPKANLPANIADMASALLTSASQAGVSNGPGDLYAKMNGKTGVFEYGVEGTEFEEGSIWAVNPAGLLHGYTAWGSEERGNAGKNVGEVLVKATQPMPSEESLPAVNGDWTPQVAIQMRCTNGEDEGVQVLFKTNSHGGRKAYADLLQALVLKAQTGEPDFVPLVECTTESYKHKVKTYGTIYNPVFKIVGWTTMDGASLQEPKAVEAEPEAVEEAPRRRRRKA